MAAYLASKQKAYAVPYRVLGALIFTLGFGLFAQGLYIPAKALLAQQLIQRAWVKTVNTSQPTLPWAWMDAHPIARLTLPNQKSYIVLNEDSGQALAFGPALVRGTSLDGTSMTAIAAHKNTQFMSLKTIKTGDIISLQTADNQTFSYQVNHQAIIDTQSEALLDQGKNSLVLITCYPFNNISFNGPLRYVVYAEKLPSKV